MDVTSYLSKQQETTDDDLSKEWSAIEDLYTKKLWHQLTLKLLTFVKHPYFQNENSLIELYDNFLSDFENKINSLSLVEITAYIIKQIKDEEAIAFVNKIKEKVKTSKEAIILCNTFIGQLKLQLDKLDEVKKLINETETMLDDLDGVTTVHGRFYELSSDYYRVIGNYADYYKNTLRFLGCMEMDMIPADEQVSKAFSLSLAALLGEGIYNFGELLAHNILEKLKDTNNAWLIELLYAFNSGSLDKYEKLRDHWKSQPDLAYNEPILRQKISLLCLMEMTFKRDANNRQLSFEEIAEEARIPTHEVEHLVMKAFSLGLVKGSIDQMDLQVKITWVQPRVLDKDQISSMLGKLDSWCKDVNQMEKLIELKAADILT